MKVKRILAALISAAMVMPSVPIVSQAALVSGADKAQMNMVLLEPDDSQTIKFKEVTANDLSLTKDSEFYVGIKMVNFKNIEEAANYVAGSKGGLNDIAAGIAYNTEYVQFEPDCQYPDEGSYILSTDDVITNWNKRMDFADSILKKNKMPAKYKYLDAMIEEMDTTTTDSQKGYTKEVDIAVSSSTATSSTRAKYSGADDAYFAIVKFKFMKDATTAPAGTNIVGFSSNPQFTSMSFGISGDADKVTYQYEGAESGNIQSIFNVVDFRGVDILPAGAARKTGISVKSGTMASTQFVGDVFKPGVNLQFNYDDGSHKDLGESDTVTYKYGAAGITAADDSGLTAIPATLKTEVDGKHIYAIVGNFICDLGALTVSEIKTTEITVSGAPTTAYDGTAINFNDLVATIKKNNGTSVGDLKFTNYENVSNDLAIYKSNVAGDVLAQVTALDKYTNGVNYFVVAVKSDRTVKSAVFTVTSNYDDITITKDTNAKTLYNKGDKFDPSAIAVKAKKASETGEGTKVSYTNFDSNYKVVIATSAEAAKTATAVDANTDITETMLDGTHKVYVVYKNAGSGTQSVAEVGTLGAKKITGGSLTVGKIAYTYGDKFDTTVKFTPTYDDGSTGTEISFADLAAAGITVTIDNKPVTADTVITPAMNGKTVDFKYDSSKAPVQSKPITVAKKTIKYSVSNTPITKVYDGNTDAPSSTALPAITTETLVGTDTCTLTGTFAFTDKNAGTNKDVKLTINESTLSDDIKAKYSFVPDGTTVLANGVLAAKGEIAKKTLTLNAGVITGLSTKADPNATADVTKDGSLVLTKDNSNLVDGDNVTVPYTYTFAKDDVKTAGNDKNVTITLKDLTGADKDNYTFDKTQVTTAKGNVTQEAFSDIEISGPTKVTYTYPELTPDFSGLVVNAVYGTGASATKAPVTNYKLLDKDGNEFNKTAKLPYGDTTITVSYTEGSVTKTKTITLTAKKKPIKLSDITFEASKAYGDNNVNASATLPTDAIVATDADKVKLTFKAEFATPEQVGDAQKVTFSDFKFAKVGEGEEDVSGNYVLVKDDGKTEIDANTTVEGTGKITQGTQVAPVAPTVSVDQKTNNIVVAGPLGDNIEYSINGTDWQTGTTFTGLENGKAYTVSARYKATETLAASPASTADATTYKNHLVVYKVNTSTSPLAEIYTNETSATSDNDINTKILTAKPSKFKAYFTDLAGKTAITYPFTLSTETTLYMSQTAGGGGGGGGRSVSIKLDKDTVSGVVGDKIKVTATVTGSTAKPTWTSSNEDVATVDENGNITFVGKGTATVKVKVNGVVKNIPVTVKEATATPTPVPTVKPTDAPVINTEYTKPYASGYDDGSFLPNNNITRGELAAMIARLSYGDDLPDGMYQASFPDVDSDAWFNKYIGYLEDKDVLSGYEDGTFRPMDTITRGEISAVIARAQRYDLISYNNIFTDVTENDWAKDYIETLADKNIVSGYEDGTFGPYSPLTRAEAVAIINRVLVESTPIVTFTPNDIAGHWAEADILLAVNERKVGANAVVPTVKPEETAAPEETVAPETTVTPEATVAPEKTTAPEATPAA